MHNLKVGSEVIHHVLDRQTGSTCLSDMDTGQFRRRAPECHHRKNIKGDPSIRCFSTASLQGSSNIVCA